MNATKNETVTRATWLLAATPLVVLLTHAAAYLPHEFGHSVVAWLVGIKDQPWNIDWGGSGLLNIFLLRQVDENVVTWLPRSGPGTMTVPDWMSPTPDRDQVVLPDRALSVAYEPLGELSRREIAQSAMRTKVVILNSPRFDLFPGIIERQEPVGVQALIPEWAVKRLDKRVVGRPVRTREVERDPLLVCPLVEDSAGELARRFELTATYAPDTSSR